MPDLLHEFGGDLVVDASGDLDLVIGSNEVRQALCHRLLTSPRGYIWHLDYGAGLRQIVGSNATAQQISAIIRAQLLQDVNVAPVPPPQIIVSQLFGGYVIATINYIDATSGSQQTQELVLEK